MRQTTYVCPLFVPTFVPLVNLTMTVRVGLFHYEPWYRSVTISSDIFYRVYTNVMTSTLLPYLHPVRVLRLTSLIHLTPLWITYTLTTSSSSKHFTNSCEILYIHSENLPLITSGIPNLISGIISRVLPLKWKDKRKDRKDVTFLCHK